MKFPLITSLILATLFIAPGLQAQSLDTIISMQDTDSFSSRKQIEITRTDLAPVLDGILDDEIWKNATIITDLHQYKPIDHANPSEQTIFYITYSDRYFYVAAKLYHATPSTVSARQLIQGSGFGSDDSFEFMLDTFNNGRTGYNFEVNPNGIRREGVYQNPNSLDRDWSGIWQVESRIDDEGWTAEVAIPFTTLNFDPNSEEWGFNIARNIAHLREDVAWSSFNKNVDPSTSGLITGIRNIKQGVGLDIVPSINISRAENFIANTSDTNADPSLDVFYKITPNLTAALTLNTDFSATEVDNQQINLSRFSLFFPEKRDFFIQDAGIFSFGGLDQNGIPFYSRRIGLSNSGQPVDINAGIKLTGRAGRWNVGSLIVNQDAQGDVDSQTVFVGRATVNVLAESNIGVIVTDGDPGSNNDNSVVGMDFRYQQTRFSSSHSLRGNLWYQESETADLNGDDRAFGFQANLDTSNNGFGGSIQYQRFGEDFNPALGFANRRGIENVGFNLNGRYFLNNHPLIRNVFSFMFYGKTQGLGNGELQSENLFWRIINVNTHAGDQAGFGFGRNTEGLQQDFQIRPDIVIPAGEYSYSNGSAEIRFSNQRLFSGSINFNKGGYFNGDRQSVGGFIRWRPNEHLNISANYNYQEISLPAGDFSTRQIRFNANYAFNAKVSWLNLLQYDNGSNSIGVNSRLRWTPQAGEDLFLVVNYNLASLGAFDQVSLRSSSIVIKYTKTFRY